MIKVLKENLESSIRDLELGKANLLFKKYMELNPADLEVFIYGGIINYYLNDLDTAEEFFKSGLQVCKFNFDLNYNLALVLESKGRFIEATRYYQRALHIGGNTSPGLGINTKVRAMIDKITKSRINDKDKNNIVLDLKDVINEELQNANSSNKVFPFLDDKKVLAGEFFKGEYFIGIYDNYGQRRDGVSLPFNIMTRSFNAIEMYKASRKRSCVIKGDAIVPVCTLDNDTKINIISPSTNNKINNQLENRYYYYKINGGARIVSDKEVVFGNPISLNKNNNLKDIVLNIFIDGLSQTIFDEFGIENVMPNTFAFFSDGVMCNNVHAVAEWTLPSVASIFTGKYTTCHRVYHPLYNTELPNNDSILSEIMKDSGYFTAKIDGNWRSTPPYGYHRGIDRTIYKPSLRSMGIDEVIPELIEHIESFRDTNQFIWTCMFDAHEIADGFEPRISAQVSTDVQYRDNSKIIKVEKSVKQGYDEAKKQKYINQLKRIDVYLGLLYGYLNNNFDEDRILVSLISDHGQSYLVPENSPLLAPERTKVPMMFKGGGVKKGICSELIEIRDFMSIIYSLSCNETSLEDIHGRLPKYFGGTGERDFTYSESIFPGDTYKATLNFKKYICYFETKELTRVDGRVNIDEYEIKLIDNCTKEEIINEVLEGECLDIIFKHMELYRVY